MTGGWGSAILGDLCDHRPGAAIRMPRSATVLVFLLLALAAPARADMVLTVLDEINALRRQYGLAAVQLEPRLTVEARHHASDMARHDYFDTRTPTGEAFESRLDHAGYLYRRVFVQLAVGFPGPIGLVANWSSAADTRKYLLDPSFTDVGLGYAAKGAFEAGRGRLDHFWVLTLAEPTQAFAGDWRGELLRRINAFRAGHGLVALRPDPTLDAAAQAHADDMARRDYFGHESPEGETPGERATRAGYPWRRVFENLAAGQPTPAEAVEGWERSPGHRRAMLDPEVREAGIGYTFLPHDGGAVRAMHYWSLSMGRRM